MNDRYGWICPKCNRSCAPHLTNCPCNVAYTAPKPLPPPYIGDLPPATETIAPKSPLPPYTITCQNDGGFANVGIIQSKSALD